MSLKQKFFIAVMSASLALGSAVGATASPWQDHHPRRVEVNHRLEKQNIRVNRNLHKGRITPAQAAYLHHKTHMIRMRERHDARLHGGHLTGRELARLNHRENRVSRQIYRDAH